MEGPCQVELGDLAIKDNNFELAFFVISSWNMYKLAKIAHVHVVGIIVVIVEHLKSRNNLDPHLGLVVGMYLQRLVNLMHFLYDNAYEIWMEGYEWRHHGFYFICY